jgi:hypothetical protein
MRVGILAGLVSTGLGVPAAAQPSGGTPRTELAVGGFFLGPMPIADASAAFVRPDGSPFPVFRTSTSIRPGPGVEVHLARRLGARWAAELSGAWAFTRLRTRVSGDVEDAPAATATERLWRYAVEASAVWTVRGGANRAVFLRGGAGWMREAAGTSALGRDGIVGNVGAGVKYWWGSTPDGGRRWGVRLEGRAVLRARGVDLGARHVRAAPAAAAGLLIGF